MMAPELLGGRYQLRGVVGRGGMAEVHDGWDTRLGHAVAIKLMYQGCLGDPDSLRRFRVEAHSAAALSHPNIVAVYDIAEHNSVPFIAMERLPGHSLADRLAYGPLPSVQVRDILDDVLAALSSAHAAGILHRDIKPANILFTQSGSAKVADFGIAKTPWADPTLTGQIVGTMAYLSPDRVAGEAAGVADDLYSVGVVGYESLVGGRPFAGDNMAALARAILAGERAPLLSQRPDADPVLAAAIERAMGHPGEPPFSDAQEMRSALGSSRREAIGRRPPTRVMTTPLPPPPTVFVPQARPAGRNRRVVFLGAALIATLVAALGFVFDSATRADPPNPAPVTTSTPVAPAPVSPAVSPPPPPAQSAIPDVPDKPQKKGNGHGKRH